MKSTVVAALLLAPVLGLAGCSSDDSSDPAPPLPTQASDPTSTSPSPTQSTIITPATVPDIPKFKGKPAGIIADVDTTECTTDPGVVTASGTVKNTAPGPDPRDIAISMSWVAEGGSDVLARGVIKLPAVPAGVTKSWKVTGQLDATIPVLCVPTAQRGVFAGPAAG